MKNIEDAVIELGGKAPERTFSERTPNNYYISTNCICLNGEVICHIPDFIEQAKRLGYISGYRWGIEYPTNGKRPDLADGTVVEARYPNGDWHEDGEDDVFDFLWKAFSHFRITDQRHKPADTSYLNECEYNAVADIDQLKVECMRLIDDKPVDELAVSHSSIDGIHAGDKISIEGLKRANHSWHERGELPPVGFECDSYDFSHSQWVKVKTLDAETGSKELACVTVDEDGTYGRLFWGCKFRPIRTEREKVIEAALVPVSIWHLREAKKGLEALYDAGMLVLPPKKRDTKD